MTKEVAIKRLETQKKMACMGCMHQVGYCENICELPQTYDMAIEALKQEPRRKGKWIGTFDDDAWPKARCSACGEETLYGVYFDIFHNRHQMNYCPNCGAEMEK